MVLLYWWNSEFRCQCSCRICHLMTKPESPKKNPSIRDTPSLRTLLTRMKNRMYEWTIFSPLDITTSYIFIGLIVVTRKMSILTTLCMHGGSFENNEMCRKWRMIHMLQYSPLTQYPCSLPHLGANEPSEKYTVRFYSEWWTTYSQVCPILCCVVILEGGSGEERPAAPYPVSTTLESSPNKL